MTQAHWRLKPFDRDRIAALGREVGVAPLIAHLLLNRGVTDSRSASTFFDERLSALHDPESLPGVVDAADRIVRAIRAGRKIVIYGDYDVDGVCGTSILWACLKLAGAADVEYYIPHRVEEGYGLNSNALRRLAKDHRAEVVITVDCGISAVEEARLARELGVELIITDHHTIGADLPDAAALVHPRLPGSRYPFGELCGCAVAFKLAWQICKTFGDGKKTSPHLRDFLMKSVALVAMATVADMVPVQGENRILVRHGLAGLASSPSPGLQALMGVAGCLGKKELSTGMVSFSLAPRINAAGRLERAMQAVEMLTTDDAARAQELAEGLEVFNKQRQVVEKEIVQQARALIDGQGGLGNRGAIVLGQTGWHLGVVGIVASRIVEIYHRPTIILALNDDHAQGSARSISGFNLYDALHACSSGLTSFGGHAAAAGLKLPRAHFEEFAEAFEVHCRSAIPAEQRIKSLTIDAEIPLASLTLKLVEAIEKLEPYGIGNPKPLLVANNVQLVGDPRFVGEGGNTVQLRFTQGSTTVKGIAFKMAERFETLKAGMFLSVAFNPSINEWNNRRDVQLEIKDFRVEEVATQAQSA